MSKNLDITLLLDFYGDMLTDKQRSFISYYYNDDLSLSEIAADEGITRQGVRDAIKRAETQLIAMEERLGLVARFENMKIGLSEIIEYAEEIAIYNRRNSLSMEVNDSTAKIKAIAQTLLTENYS
ncbi:MAG: sigma factor-like helix-turn-helix DNA-binding protein [Acutalibacteraceae bacterium]|nr:sigma factor-like helix-turn-helix DNA-binding protein [Acutalibacteraceae bacterium]